MSKMRKYRAEFDFTPSMMPHNRKEVFYDVVKLHFLDLLKMGAIIFLFSLPLLFVILSNDLYTQSLLAQLKVDKTVETISNVYAQVVAVSNITGLVAVVPLLILGVGISGLLRVIRKYAWEEIVGLGHDYSVGVKQNWRSLIALSLVMGMVFAGCNYLNNLTFINNNLTINLFASISICFGLFLLLPIFLYMLVGIAIYNNTFWQNVTLGFYLYMKHPFKTLWAVFCAFGFYFLFIVSNTVVHAVVILLGSFVLPFALLGWFLFSYNILDKYINSLKHPHLVDRGVCRLDIKVPEKDKNQAKKDA